MSDRVTFPPRARDPDSEAETPFIIRVIRPPYRTFGATADLTMLRRAGLDDGVVIALEPVRWDVSEWAAWSGRLRRAAPAASFVLMADMSKPMASILAVRCALLGIQAVADVRRGSMGELRGVLTEVGLLSKEVGTWLMKLRPDLPSSAVDFAAELLRVAIETRQPVPVENAVPVSGRAARYVLSSAGLPSPSLWLSAGRALPALLDLQRHSDVPLHVVCARRGLTSARLHSLSARLFGLSPSRVQSYVGWTWLMSRFLANRKAGFRQRGGL